MSLRDKQVAALKKMLDLNENTTEPNDGDAARPHTASGLDAKGEIVWKVLVFDELGKNIISSVLRVSDLRKLGVTLHLSLTAKRHKVPDVPVIYLIEPTAANLKAITADLQEGLYSPAYVNFLSSIPRPLLEEFAAETVRTGTQEQIAQLYDQYLNFICVDGDHFSLGMEKEHTYWALNSAQTSDEQLDQVVSRIVSGLFSVVVTMGVIPIIRSPKGGASELVAAKLDRKIRDHLLSSKDNVFSSSTRPSSSAGTATSRPVLVILDRNIDLLPMLSHSWHYESLVHDVLQVKLNRVTIETPVDESNPAKGTTKKAYDLASNDFFWAKNHLKEFPLVAEDIDAELSQYKTQAAEITSKTGASSLEDLQNDMSASAQHLKAALTVLPELREKKAILDTHMTILAALLSGIKARQLDNFFQLEENVTKKQGQVILDAIKDAAKGNDPLDKLRLFVIWYLSTEQDISKAEWTQFDEALKAAGADTTLLPYIRQVRATTKMTQLTTSHAAPQQASASSDLFGRFSAISSRLTDRLKETGVPSNLSANFESLISSIRPENRDLTVTGVVEAVMDPSAANTNALAKTESYLYFDPRNSHARGSMPPPSAVRGGTMPGAAPGQQGPGHTATFGQRRQGFSEAIVFMVGGGSMEEYGNLQEWVARTGNDRARRRVVYGSSELLSAKEFCQEELERLGREIKS